MKHPLREIREKYNFTQCDVATMADMYQPHIAELEAGGLKVSKKILDVVDELGEDREKFLEKDAAFRKIRRAKLLGRAS